MGEWTLPSKWHKLTHISRPLSPCGVNNVIHIYAQSRFLFFLIGVSNLGSLGVKEKGGREWYVPVFSTSMSFHSKMFSGSSCWISAGVSVVTASKVVIHNKLAASWAEKTHSRVGKYMRTPCGRTHPKYSSHPAAPRISGVQSLQLQVSHKHSANSMKSLGISVSNRFTKGKEYAVSTLLTVHCKVMRNQA